MAGTAVVESSPSALQYLDKALGGLREVGLAPKRAKKAPEPIVALLEQISDLDPDKVAANPARGAEHQRDAGRSEIAETVTDKGLLQLFRLDQVGVDRVVECAQFVQGRADQAVLVAQFAHPGAQRPDGDHRRGYPGGTVAAPRHPLPPP